MGEEPESGRLLVKKNQLKPSCIVLLSGIEFCVAATIVGPIRARLNASPQRVGREEGELEGTHCRCPTDPYFVPSPLL